MKILPATGKEAAAIITAASKIGTGKSNSAAKATAAGCNTSLQKLNQPATSIRSADLPANDAPMANNAPGVAAAPRMPKNSLTGPGKGMPVADQLNPSTIDTIIGFLIRPIPTVLTMPSDIRPSRLPVIKITISDENTIRSSAKTISTGPAAASPISTISIGTPRKPVLPITAHCASTAASAIERPRKKATAVAMA